MIRDRDGFVGMYSLPEDPFVVPATESLVNSSRYFRLELDIAVRARKPMLVFPDHRYGQVLRVPRGGFFARFQVQELLSGPSGAERDQIRRTVQGFVTTA